MAKEVDFDGIFNPESEFKSRLRIKIRIQIQIENQNPNPESGFSEIRKNEILNEFGILGLGFRVWDFE